jgi:hypothetical protein
MGAKLHKSRQAAAQFFKTANPEDEFFLVQFSDRPQLVVPFTHETEEIQNRLAFTQSRGRTALLDALYLAMHEMKKARNPAQGPAGALRRRRQQQPLHAERDQESGAGSRRASVRDRHFRADFGARPHGGGAGRPQPAERAGRADGGRHFPVENVNELPDIAAKIGIELRNQYVLGYTPTNQKRDGKYRRVRVELVQPRGLPPLKAAYRSGYYAPLSKPRQSGWPLFWLAPCCGSRPRRPGGGFPRRDPPGGPARQRSGPQRPSGHRPAPVAFTVYENDVEQKVKIFRREDVPVSLGLIIDNSGSMRRQAARGRSRRPDAGEELQPTG